MATPLNIPEARQQGEFTIAVPMQSAAVQFTVRRAALGVGFSENAADELVLVVAELASNLLKHAGGGTLIFRTMEEDGRRGIEIESLDRGPGIGDAEQSLTDGVSTTGSLGYGLGTVHRLMDELNIQPRPGGGTAIVCRRWKRPAPDPAREGSWDVGVFTRSRRQAPENGDAFVIKQWQGELLVGLIDGLGHGELAQKAAMTAQNFVQTHFDQRLEKIFEGVGRACRATRGVVMALAHFSGPTQLSFANLGNIEVRCFGPAEHLRFQVKRGILGVHELNVRVQHFAWEPHWALVLHSDGLRSHWQPGDFPGIEREPARTVAERLMRELATDNDDATVLVARSRAT